MKKIRSLSLLLILSSIYFGCQVEHIQKIEQDKTPVEPREIGKLKYVHSNQTYSSGVYVRFSLDTKQEIIDQILQTYPDRYNHMQHQEISIAMINLSDDVQTFNSETLASELSKLETDPNVAYIVTQPEVVIPVGYSKTEIPGTAIVSFNFEANDVPNKFNELVAYLEQSHCYLYIVLGHSVVIRFDEKRRDLQSIRMSLLKHPYVTSVRENFMGKIKQH